MPETRPLLQGARLTAYELAEAGVRHTLVTDNATGAILREGAVAGIVVGADRIAANGDTANKIGTYNLAVLAHHHGVPFYVVAPTVDHRSRHAVGRRDPDRAAPEDEVTELRRRRHGADRHLRPQRRVRRHAGRADHRDRDRARRAPAALRSGRGAAV